MYLGTKGKGDFFLTLVLFVLFAREQHDQNEIHSSSFETSREEAGISSLFFWIAAYRRQSHRLCHYQG